MFEYPLIACSSFTLIFPVESTSANTVPALFCHCCKSAVCDAAPRTITPTVELDDEATCNCAVGVNEFIPTNPAGVILNLIAPAIPSYI